MNLLNFELGKEDIYLEGFGYSWDLHNFAKFAGIEYIASSDLLKLEWKVPNMTNPWGCPDNQHAGCRLEFRGLKTMRISESDTRFPPSEGTCLHGISKITAPATPGQSETETAGLLFHFQNGREIEILAISVELIAL